LTTPAPHAAPIAEPEFRARVAAVQHALEARGLDGLLCLEPLDVVYLSGFFHATNERPVGCFVPLHGEPSLLVPLLESEHASEGWISRVETYREFPGRRHPVAWMVERCGAARLGVDALDVRLARALAEAGRTLTPCEVVERLRWRKSPAELALARAAARYADRCLEHVSARAGAIVAAGGSERDILAAALRATEEELRAALGDAFDGSPTRVVGTVHSGPRAALPHGHTSARRPQRGDVLIAGIGVAVGGYHAESGATFTFGPPTEDQRRCLAAAAACDQAARDACRPGATGEAVDAAAADVIRAAGLEASIRHRIGHGMGLGGHESPYLAPGGTEAIEAGMVFSNEPGIYRPGVDGYRTINTLIVHADGVEVASRFQATHPVEARVLEV
jgi:Xaa-Pro dipeptidase